MSAPNRPSVENGQRTARDRRERKHRDAFGARPPLLSIMRSERADLMGPLCD
jgi:hypothetical protein